jgi:MFS family permease
MLYSKNKDDILYLIKQKRAQVEIYLSKTRPRKRRLINTTIIAGTFATALTAAPAIGGQVFTTWLTSLFGLTSPSWRILCASATLCSIMATIATQLLKSNNIEDNVTRALGCRAKLELLEVSLNMSQMDAKQATIEYLKCVNDIAFLEN